MEKSQQQQLIDSMLEYLPTIANAIAKIVSVLSEAIKLGNPRDPQLLTSAMNELQSILPELEKAVKTGRPNVDPNVASDYYESLTLIVDGLKAMLDWMANEDIPNEKLKKSIDFLFEGSQKLSNFVQKLTT